MKRSTCLSSLLSLVSVVALGAACSSDAPVGNGSGGTRGPGGGSSAGGSGAGGATAAYIDLDAATVSSREAGVEEAGTVCRTQQMAATIEPARLVFAFDVSGSMGEGDETYHDKSLKWDPVVAATKGFFADPNSQGIEASLVFFPTGDDDDVKCSASTYAVPQVPMTPLPSTAFATAIDTQYPDGDGTPTVAVIEGSLQYLRAQRTSRPGKYVLVLATDGYPASCGSRNSINNASSAVAAALADGISTYVIGVKNPPLPEAPDVTSNLSQIATAGGTKVFFLDTGTPSTTQQAFAAAINQIRGAAIACEARIPEPPAGLTFDKKKVIITYTSGTNAPVTLTYDAACAGAQSWHYDNVAAPTRVVLCPSTCSAIQADRNAVLNVGFTCDQVISVIP